ncbi:MAG: PD-(D/E)XK nuclease family protein [Bryobacteraceae bacterium]
MRIADALSSGATLIVPTARQARHWRRRYNAAQLQAGLRAWPDPAIYPAAAWISRLAEAQQGPVPLTPWQEADLWERTVSAGSNPLQPAATARAARGAWNLLNAWLLPRHGPAWSANPDSATFLEWVRAHQAALHRLQRTDTAAQPAAIAPHDAGRLIIASAEPLEPAIAALFERLQSAGTQVDFAEFPASRAARLGVLACPDAAAELDAVIEWAAARHRADPEARIGVAFADLDSIRARAAHRFRQALGNAVHVALGPPLASQPLVHGALTVLSVAAPSIDAAAWTELLMSPWIAGRPLDRVQCEASARRTGLDELTPDAIASLRGCPPDFRDRLSQAIDQTRAWPARQSAREWSVAFARLLTAMGWPGDAPLASGDYQALGAWQDALSAFAALEATAPPMDAASAIASLRRGLAGERFQVEDRGEPVQVMSIAEAAGLAFDHLIVAGVHDAAWPPPPAPSPFLPLALQRDYGLPRVTSARQLEHARRLTATLAAAAGEVVFSYPRNEGERRLRPSPLLRSEWGRSHPALGFSPAPPPPVAIVDDWTAPPIPEGTLASGGARTLELQAACPFRAFAESRLAAGDQPAPELGFDPRERGIILHAALECCWKELRASAALQEDVSAAVERAVAQALARRPAFSGFQKARLRLEHARLAKLLTDWLMLEKERPPFEVAEQEREQEVTVAGLHLRTRMDRVDRIEDGGVLLIDYKTTAPPLTHWEGERPDSPQVPLYAVASGLPVTAAAFAQVKAGDLRFRGIGTARKPADGIRTESDGDFGQRKEEWRAGVESLAAQIRAGAALPDPKHGEETCKRCHLQPLCRIHDI